MVGGPTGTTPLRRLARFDDARRRRGRELTVTHEIKAEIVTIQHNEPVGSGQTYVVADVDGRPPRALDDFSGASTELLIRREQQSCHIVGAGTAPMSGSVRFHQKDGGPDGKDVRVWLITDRGDGTFCAEALSLF